MTVKIDIKGDIISNDAAWLYDWLEWDYTSPNKIKNDLEKANGKDVEFLVNSPGGDVFSGYDIYNQIADYSGHTTANIVGLAASCGSFIPMACEKIVSQPMAMMMIHGASTRTYGNQHDHGKTKDFLSKVDNTIVKAYTQKTGKSDEELLDLMAKETWFTADEMLEMGLIDEIKGKKVDVKVYNSLDDTGKLDIINKLLELGNPENIQKAMLEGKINIGQGVVDKTAIDNKPKEGKEETKMTVDELKKDHSDVYDQIVKDVTEEAVKNERERITAINALRGQVTDAEINEAISNGISAEKCAYNSMINNAQVNKQVADKIAEDTQNSGVNNVPQQPQQPKDKKEDQKAEAKSLADLMNGGKN